MVGSLHLKNVSAAEIEALFPYTSILVGYRGSIAHNMYIPSTDPLSIDDKDVMGISVGPLASYWGLQRFEGRETQLREWDVVVYEVRKFVRLLTKANPNVLSLLWLQPQHYLLLTTAGQMLCDHRDLFLTKQLYHSFTGYAHGQLKRMTHHAFQGYMGQKRKGLVEQFGYDTKNAAHLIRLLRMGIEALVTGTLQVFRSDASELLEIKRGQWPLPRVQAEAEHLFRCATEAFVKSSLPNKVSPTAVDELLIKVLEQVLRPVSTYSPQ
jgi:predicted nucleotidyltransferase